MAERAGRGTLRGLYPRPRSEPRPRSLGRARGAAPRWATSSVTSGDGVTTNQTPSKPGPSAFTPGHLPPDLERGLNKWTFSSSFSLWAAGTASIEFFYFIFFFSRTSIILRLIGPLGS